MAEVKKGGCLWHPIYGKSGYMYAPDIWHRIPVDPEKPADLKRSLGVLVRFPDDWKDRPWTPEEIEAWKKRNQAAPEVKAETPSEAAQAPAPTKHGLPRGRPRGRPFKKKEPQAVAAE